ncbi:hypothetical protein DO021_05420 [Desulfobacter hydrogenophilus]|uniref:Flagellar protein FliL n=1 Tax=Desulfobacter hydrogenophilus TaxID=2291 RepID=A0A328FGW1_9BACT|nr:hypothetical protein [Desulfobacter hydrogenophilus]NDY70934.1 hypothetical protein [Desulfobacter hydrogenophilus]QBH12824.1 hypothetical protein EYB58_07805 [Desulfobacter hydrogenophilus]RAM03060.1 hypothetical protein DO021_05420 [Desulfobacter hydrogenophilus]
MSDPILEEDDLISQDDIDKMLDISSGDDDAGELSQDDIDSLLNGPDQDEEKWDTEEEDAGELSQDDIDSMMTGNALDDDDSPEEDDAGELDQDEIGPSMNESQDSGSGDDDELISLEDIQGAMGGDTQEENASDSGLEPEALDDETVDDAPVVEASGQEEDPFDDPIDEDQAADVTDCMLTQETMEALIKAGLPAPDVTEGDTGEPEADAGEDNLPDGIGLTSATDDGGADDDVQEEENDVTQEDIDALLQQSNETDDLLDDDEDILISQDDINTLLMAADQEDEDVLGDIDGEDYASDLEDQFDDLESDSDQVVLEGIEEAEIPGEKKSLSAESPKKSEKIKALLKSKIILAAASVLLFMGISVPLSYFLFFSSEPPPLPERQTASLTEIDLIRDGQANVSGNMPVLPPSRKSGTILLTDFIILASDQSRTMTYVYADVSIDYSDQRAYDEINSNLAFYRDLIYGAIQTRLVSEKNNEVTEADLLWDVEASLKKVLPPQYIDKISFKSFKAT